MKNGIKVKGLIMPFDVSESWTDTGTWAGEYHRIDGPAIIYHNGNLSWYINGIKYLRLNEYLQYTELSDGDKLILALKYSEFHKS